jgi:hypothetical protein
MIASMINVIVRVISVQLSALADNHETRGDGGTGSSVFWSFVLFIRTNDD